MEFDDVRSANITYWDRIEEKYSIKVTKLGLFFFFQFFLAGDVDTCHIIKFLKVNGNTLLS